MAIQSSKSFMLVQLTADGDMSLQRPPVNPPANPVKRFVDASRCGGQYVAIYKDYNNTKIKVPTKLLHATNLNVYPKMVGNGWYRIATGSYAGWYIQGTYLSSSAPKTDDESSNKDGEEKKDGNPGASNNADPSPSTIQMLVGAASKLSEGLQAIGKLGHQLKVEEDKKKADEAAALKAAVRQASPKTAFVPDEQLYNFRSFTGDVSEFNESVQMAISDFTNAFGAPFLFSNDTDPCYYKADYNKADETFVGHTMMRTMYSSPAVFSICPGKVSYLPNLLGRDNKNVFEMLADKFSDVPGTFEDIVGVDKENSSMGAFGKQLYAFTPDYNDYINRLNTIARISAMFMGIGDRVTPWNKSTKYKNADYTYFTTGKRTVQPNKDNVIDNFLWQIKADFEDGLDTTTDKYIHFFLTADGSAVEQDFITNNSELSMFNELNGGDLQRKVKEINFLFNGAMSSSDTWNMIDGDLKQLGESIGSHDTIGSLMNMVKGWAQGGRMLIPDMIDEVQYNSSVTCHLNFRSLYGDPESVFLNVNLPCLALLCFVLPKQMAENMYGYPYVCRCFQRGCYNSDLCFISNLNFRRGGDSDTSWTESGIPTEVEATFTITPLYSALMGGNGRNPFLFMSNTALIEYLGNMCGLDIKVDQIELKTRLIENLFVDNFMTDIPSSSGRRFSDWASGKFEHLFNFN